TLFRSCRDHLGRLVDLRAQALVQPGKLADDLAMLGVRGAVGAGRRTGPSRARRGAFQAGFQLPQDGAVVIRRAGLRTALTERRPRARPGREEGIKYAT